jgi:sulfur carrier protein
MIITLNGAKCDVADGTSVADLIATSLGGGRGGAAMVDGEIVPRSSWELTTLIEGQSVELVMAVQGG